MVERSGVNGKRPANAVVGVAGPDSNFHENRARGHVSELVWTVAGGD